ncbi:MAG: hypothetical protein JKY19_11210 [Alcanivoracaceae bacterium]|nr:hypothetical protein [Alcanivoracaceae bacterium]
MTQFFTNSLLIIVYLIPIIIAIKLISSVFKISKSLEGIDETLYQIYKKIDESKNNENE